MTPCIQFNDTIRLIITEPDEYGSEHISTEADVPAAVELNTGYIHAANQDGVTSDAIVFLNPTTEFVLDNYYRLEEAMVVIQLFGTPESEAWYKVTNVIVARDHQLCNEVDHLELQLKKSTEVLTNVS